jgi:hypothetical protein
MDQVTEKGPLGTPPWDFICLGYLLLGCSIISVFFIICMLTLLLMPLADLHFHVGLDFVTPSLLCFLSKHHHHLLRGEAISWLYTLALLDAIYMIEKEQELFSLSKLQSNYESKLVQLLPPLPPPKKCEQGLHCTERPICHTNYMPHHPSNMTLSELIIGSTLWDIDASGICKYIYM